MNTSRHLAFRRRLSLWGRSSFLLATTALLSTVSAQPEVPSAPLEEKVSPSEATTNSYFGTSVALQGATALIGAPGENSVTGAAYFYNNSGGTWTEGQRIAASDGQANDQFGHIVAIQGDTAVVSAYVAKSHGVIQAGAVYIFTRSGGVWAQSQKLAVSGVGQAQFGSALSLNGNYLVVGARAAEVGGLYNQGAAYVFFRHNGVWRLSQQLTASDGAGYSIFGESVAISNGLILVGAPDTEVNGQTYQGAVYVYTLSGQMFTETQKITTTNGQENDNFGYALAFDGTTALINAGTATVDGHQYAGKAYIFTNNDGTFTQSQELLPPAPQDFGAFAHSVALNHSTAAIGDFYGQGFVNLYDNESGIFTLSKRVTASDGQPLDAFGQSVAIVPGTLLVGTQYPTVDGHTNQGVAYFYSHQPQ